MMRELGEEYTVRLRKAYADVPSGVDLVAYWFAKAWEQMQNKRLERAGLVATQSLRGEVNRTVLQPVVKGGQIFSAWADEEWTVDGAAVRVCLVAFSSSIGTTSHLNGQRVAGILSDLSPDIGGFDRNKTRSQTHNRGIAFQGSKKIGPFEISGVEARYLLGLPTNPNGKKNSDVILKSWIGIDVAQRDRDVWIINFDPESILPECQLFEEPFRIVFERVKPERDKNRREIRKKNWWFHGDPQKAMRRAIKPLWRFIVTPEVSKFRIFRWCDRATLPDCKLMVIAKSDDTTFGILQSRFHELWSLKLGAWHGDGKEGGRPRYTPSTAFETFPFPKGLTPNIPAADFADDLRARGIAKAAVRLNELRENWLNPDDLVDRFPEVVAGYPDRIVPRDDAAAKELKKRTLTNLYNVRPAWLEHAHKALDEAVAEAYGWGDDWRHGLLTDDEILARLFQLNQQRAAAAAKAEGSKNGK